MNRMLTAAIVIAAVYFASSVWLWRTSVIANADKVGACADAKIAKGVGVKTAYAACEGRR